MQCKIMLGLAATTLSVASLAYAQPATSPDTAAVSPTAPAPQQQRQFVLKSVVLDGARTLDAATLSPSWSDLTDKEISVRDLRRIARAIESVYADHGYPFTAVVTPPQTLKDGVVHLTVIEGSISSIVIVGADPTARRQASATFEPLKAQHPLPADSLDRAALIARSIPGLTSTTSLGPAAEVGAMELLVKASRTEWAASADLNNGYSRALGFWAMSAQLTHYGDSAFGDQATALILTAPDFRYQRMFRASYSRGLNADGLSASVSALVGGAKPVGSFAQLNIAADVVNVRAELDQIFILKPNFAVNGSAAFEWNDQSTDVFANTALTRDRLRVLSLGLSGTNATPQTQVGWSLEFRQGLDFADASHRNDVNLSRNGGDPHASLLRGTVAIQQSLWAGWKGSVRIQGQYTDQPLLVPEQFSIGNLSIVRGYDPSALLGDKVVAAAIEVHTPPFKLPWKTRASLFGFADGAALSTVRSVVPDHWAASRGLGASFAFANGMTAEVTVVDARRVAGVLPNDQVLFTLHAPLEHLGTMLADRFMHFRRSGH